MNRAIILTHGHTVLDNREDSTWNLEISAVSFGEADLPIFDCALVKARLRNSVYLTTDEHYQFELQKSIRDLSQLYLGYSKSTIYVVIPSRPHFRSLL